MTESEFISEIEEIVEAPSGSLSLSTAISSMDGWDSMAVLSFIVMADSKLGVSIDVDELNRCTSVEDLKGLCKGKVE